MNVFPYSKMICGPLLRLWFRSLAVMMLILHQNSFGLERYNLNSQFSAVDVRMDNSENAINPTLAKWMDQQILLIKQDPIKAAKAISKFSANNPDKDILPVSIFLNQYLENHSELEKSLKNTNGRMYPSKYLFHVVHGWAYHYYLTSKFPLSIEWASKAINIANELNNKNYLVAALITRSTVYYEYDQSDEAYADTVEAITISKSLKDPFYLALVANGIAGIHHLNGQKSDTYKFAQRAIDYSLKAKNWQQAGIYFYNLALFQQENQEFQTSIKNYRQSLKYAKRAKDNNGIAFALYNLGLLEADKGNHQKALNRLRESVDFFKKVGDKLMVQNALLDSSHQAIKTKNYDLALRLLNQLESDSKTESQGLNNEIIKLTFKKDIYKEKGQFKMANRTMEELIPLVEVRNKQVLDKHVQDSKRDFENELNKNAYKTLETENQLKEQRLKEIQRDRDIFVIVTICAVIFLLSLGFLLLHNIRLKRQLESLSYFDDLTKLPNRRHIYQLALNEFNRFKQFEREFALAIIDLDQAREIREHHGDESYDLLLKEIAHDVSSLIRTSDLLGRATHAAFIILLPETSRQEAENLLERIRIKISNQPYRPIDDEKIKLAIGYSAPLGNDDTVDKLIDRADQALYIAKARGLNEVEYRGA